MNKVWPNHVALIKSLDSESKIILMVLLSMDHLPKIYISNEKLSELCSLSQSTIKRRLVTLQNKSYINRKTQGYGKTMVTKISKKRIKNMIKHENPKTYHAIFNKGK